MNNVDKASRDAKILIDSARDTVANNLMNAVKTGVITLDESQLGRLMSLMNLSLDEGYQKALPYFQNSLKKYF